MNTSIPSQESFIMEIQFYSNTIILIYLCNGKILDCSKTTEGVQIPQDIFSIENFESKAKYILIIEKNSSFQKAINEGLLKKNECSFILITGKGYPDINTRLFVKKLSCKLKIQVLALVDANPFGIEIMCVYKYGSNTMIQQNEMLSVPSIKWLGVHPTDIQLLDLPSIPLNNLDQARLKALLKRSYINSNYTILQQVLILQQLNLKAEIEALTTFTQKYLTEVYILRKIVTQDYI
ncbi:Meiotic recombination, Spo11,Topoisomerase 6 subunit A/Spo11, TOPRIM domain,Spo11/DNA topoisomerase VI [Cinara cedri]|uniref:Meiotic recombination, Spo11,Topoisomerase 6 subunit A/Spo11, TOPRIM domain,Spo11/DNA topoisomerase VI n=1 Tax=Cinara cedri TaxID=506608 RepID=A0A5E4MQK2_9HEMI|nr:Meiotic recombination, Spo11,Topoisomerase 6 subunit A/Spo11, TOPRIM domain,Spo11/DNA topoisomerase VI [Cinara cedri]